MGQRERFAWCLFDFANSAFNTVVVTFLYVTYFAGALIGDQQLGDVYWLRMLVVTGVVVAIASPLLGALADLIGMFAIGLLLLLTVNEQRGIRRAQEARGP